MSLTFAERLRVYAIDGLPITVRLTADDARRIATALDNQPHRVTVTRTDVRIAMAPSEAMRVYWAVMLALLGAELIRMAA